MWHEFSANLTLIIDKLKISDTIDLYATTDCVPWAAQVAKGRDMKIKNVRVEQSQTFDLGDFNSVKIGISLFANLEDDEEDVSTAIANLQSQCKAAIKEAAKPFVPYIRLPRVEERVGGMTVAS